MYIARPFLPSDGGTGTSTAPTNGQIPIGITSTGLYAPATITAGSTKISITNGAGSISIDVVQANLSLSSIGGSIALGTQVSGQLGLGNGGTGQASAAASFNALNPMTTTGDIIYESAASTASRLAGNTSATRKFLTQTGNGTISAAPVWNTIGITDGGTGLTATPTDGQLMIGKTSGGVWVAATLTAGSSKLSISNAGGSITLDVVQANLSLGSIGGTVTLTTQVTGILPPANGGTGVSTTPVNGAIPIGNTSTGLYVSTTLTAGSSKLTITNGAGSISIDVVQANLSLGSIGGTLALSQLATQATGTIVGNNTGSTAAPIALTSAQVTAMLGTFTNSLNGLVPAGGSGSTSVFLNGAGTFTTPSGGSGTVTSMSSGNLSPLFTTSVATSTTTPALSFSLSTAAGNAVFMNASGSTAAPSYTVLTGDVTISAGVTAIGASKVTNSQLATMANLTVKGNVAGSTTNPTDLTVAQLLALIGSAAGSNLDAYLIAASSRQLPTTGAISGTYWHFGNWTQTGNITVAAGTRIYLNGTMTFVSGFTFTVGIIGAYGSGGFGPQWNAGTAQAGMNGWGPGGGVANAVSTLGASGGGGGGNGGWGGWGGHTSAGNFNWGGGSYPWQVFFGGSSGAAGNASVGANTAGYGGRGGGGVYIEVTGAISLSGAAASFLLAKGEQGAAPVTGTAGGGGGGSGGTVIIRCGSTINLGTSTSAINTAAANGTNGFNTSSGGGGGGGGGIIDIVAAGTVTHSMTAAAACTGGNGGTGSATQVSGSGASGILSVVASSTPVSEF